MKYLVPLVLLAFVFPLFAAEPTGDGILFDGKSAYQIDAKELKLSPDAFSVSAWVRVNEPDTVPNSMQIFVSLGETNMDGFKLYLNNRKPSAVRMQVEYDKQNKSGVGKTYNMAKAPIPRSEQWTHYLGTYDGKTITVYLNGKKAGEQAALCKRDAFDSPFFTLGAVSQGYYLNGALEEIRIWNRPLDADEAAAVADGKDVENGLLARWNAAGINGDKLENVVKGGPVAVPFKKQDKTKTAETTPKTETLVMVDGKPLEYFDVQNSNYVFFLPHDSQSISKIDVAKGGTVVPAEDGRSVVVTVNDAKGESRTFRIKFETLPEMDLFLCIGQSNMAGRGPMDEKKGDMKPIDNVFLFTPEGNWIPANNPLNRFSSVRKEIGMQQIGPAYSFARKIAAQTKRPIGLVVNAKGGTSIDSWLKGSKDRFFEEAVRRAAAAKPWGTFKGILWHQGESNSGQSATYPDRLKKMVGDLREALGDPKLFFVAGEIAHWRKKPDGTDPNEPFNQMIRGIGDFLPHSGTVSAADLKPLRGDLGDPHFDREGQLILGERYADAVLKAVYTEK